MFARLPRAMQYRGADGSHRRLQRAPMAITDAFSQLHIWGAAALGAGILLPSKRSDATGVTTTDDLRAGPP